MILCILPHICPGTTWFCDHLSIFLSWNSVFLETDAHGEAKSGVKQQATVISHLSFLTTGHTSYVQVILAAAVLSRL
jgi:hypothetical protein